MALPEYPKLTVVVCTFERPNELRQTLANFFSYSTYPTDKLCIHIADDGSQGTYVQDMLDELEHLNIHLSSSITPRLGWGANVNKALKYITTDLVYFTEDDYVLQQGLNLEPYVAMLISNPAIGLIRFGISAHDGVVGTIRETNISEYLPHYSENNSGCGSPGKISYFEIDRTQADGAYGAYKYSNRPHLKHRRFHDYFGYYAEGLGLAKTEIEFNQRISKEHFPEAPTLIVPLNKMLWDYDHIGVSRQGSEEDHATG